MNNAVQNITDLLEPTPHRNQRTTVPHVSTALAAPMSLTASSSAADSSIPMSRLIKVELRKTMNTRAGKWLLGTIAGGAAIVMVIVVIVGIVNNEAFGITDFTQVASFFPMGLLLPVLGVLSVTGEWGQRTNITTFTLEPRRSRVVVAKLATGAILALAATVAALVTGVVALGVFDLFGGAATWNLPIQAVISFGLLQLIGVLTGFAFGMLILNTPAAIVAFFAYSFLLPTMFLAGASLWDWAESLRPWIDFNFVQEPLFDGLLSDLNVSQFALTATIWFIAPVALGVRRLLRAEIK
jgi:ABC-2 type transport system permease protein